MGKGMLGWARSWCKLRRGKQVSRMIVLVSQNDKGPNKATCLLFLFSCDYNIFASVMETEDCFSPSISASRAIRST